MTIVTQANVAQLRTADVRRRKLDPADHEVQTPPPGPVKRFRENLIGRREISAYTEHELHLRLRESWGQFCAFCWILHAPDPNQPPEWTQHIVDHDMECAAGLTVKCTEIEGLLWRLQYEQHIRHDPEFKQAELFPARERLAGKIDMRVFGKPLADCDASTLLTAACEHAGMLAATRWMTDRSRLWGEPGIMDVHEADFLSFESTDSA